MKLPIHWCIGKHYHFKLKDGSEIQIYPVSKDNDTGIYRLIKFPDPTYEESLRENKGRSYLGVMRDYWYSDNPIFEEDCFDNVRPSQLEMRMIKVKTTPDLEVLKGVNLKIAKERLESTISIREEYREWMRSQGKSDEFINKGWVMEEHDRSIAKAIDALNKAKKAMKNENEDES